MNRHQFSAPCCVLMFAALAGGCIKSQSTGQAKPFEEIELDSCLAIIVDMSGSFSNSWGDKAFDLFTELMDRFFTEGMGGETRIVLGQLSGKEKVLLFEGPPSQLRSKFKSPEDLNTFLQENSSPSGSPVFAATGKAVGYVASMPGITENTRLFTAIFSDMKDGEGNPQTRSRTGYKMLEALKQYREKGGGLGLYFVSEDETQRWHKILNMAEFEAGAYVIQSDITAKAELPRFD